MTELSGSTRAARRSRNVRDKFALATPHHWFSVSIILLALTFILGFLSKIVPPLRMYPVDMWLNNLHTPVFDGVTKVLDLLDHPIVVVAILLLTFVVLLFAKNLRLALGTCASAGLGWLTTLLPKAIVALPRPSAEAMAHQLHVSPATLSYPSGHVVFVMALTTAIFSVCTGASARRWVFVVGVILTLITAASRLYAGVHYPTDVIGAVLNGIGGAMLVAGVCNLFADVVLPHRRQR